jgi:ATP-dependent Lon protease
VKEKVLAAHRAGIKKVILPKKNDKDLVDVPKSARRDLQFVFVEHMDAVLAEALFPAETKPGARAKAVAPRSRSRSSTRLPARPRARA